MTRVADLTRLDSTNIPVWTSERPLSRTVTIQSGKSLDPAMARAGAVVEAIEYSAAEQPQGAFWKGSEKDQAGPRLDFERFALCFGSLCTPSTEIAWEPCFHLGSRSLWNVPSDMVWLTPRVRSPLFTFQMTTNGLGSGCNPIDACLSALYEVIERDAWTLFQHASDALGLIPPKVDLSSLPGETKEILDRISRSGMRTFLFDVTTELGVPAFRAALYDLSVGNPGAYVGHGCHFDPFTAMDRALLEAAQSRACFTAGARDDLFRRGFLFLRRLDHSQSVRFLDALPSEPPFPRHRVTFGDESEELHAVLERLERHGFGDVLVKEIAREPIGEGTLHVVRAIVPGLEGHHCEMWTPGRRAKRHVQA